MLFAAEPITGGIFLTFEQIGNIKKTAVECGCRFAENEPLSRYTTFGIGGKCPLIIEVNGSESLSRLMRAIKSGNIPYYVIGKGSNLLADDKDIGMVFLHIGKDMGSISVSDGMIVCEAGAALSSVCTAARDNGLAGMEFAYGIPGTIGGAVYMNAGAYGGEIKDIIEYAEAVDGEGNLHRFDKESMKLSYRHSIFCENKFIVTKAAFRLEQGSRSEISEKMAELTAKRREKQPLEYRSAGSPFKRPEGAFAAALIEQCGLKGYTVGGAQVSEKHSGFVINLGNASFDDVMAVISHVQSVVEQKTGYRLEWAPEIIR